MRYEHWDVILFPRESLIPIQEFKTACYMTQDEHGRQLPTLTCYIVSLPPSTPIKVSFHSWIPKPKPSALIETQRKGNQRVVYTIRILIDGTRVLQDFFEVSSKWPVEIEAGKHSLTPDRQSSQRKPSLEFPPFSQTVLMRRSWDPREKMGRIKIFLGEQLVSKSSAGADVEWGHKNDVVCFSFEHAPRDILEQAGICWPIRNPLYLSGGSDIHTRPSENPASHVKPTSRASTSRQSPPGPSTEHSRPSNPEPPTRPKSNPFPEPFKFPVPPSRGSFKRPRTAIWDSSGSGSVHNDAFDDASMVDTDWSGRVSSSNFTGDMSMPDILIVSPSSSRFNSQSSSKREPARQDNSPWQEQWKKSHKNDRSFETPRDEPFNTAIETMTPTNRGNTTTHLHHSDHHHPTHTSSRAYLPPVSLPSKMGPPSGPLHPRPSAASLARKASYPSFSPHLRDTSNYRPSPKDTPNPLSTTSTPTYYHPNSYTSNNKENRTPTPYPTDLRLESPQSYMSGHMSAAAHSQAQPLYGKTGGQWEHDVEMRDPSSVFSSFSRGVGMGRGRVSPVPVWGDLRSRKEGMGMGMHGQMDHQISQTGPMSIYTTLQGRPTSQNTSSTSHTSSLSNSLSQQHTGTSTGGERTGKPEQVGVNMGVGEEEGFVPGHRSAMDSLERIEGVLYSVLGEEFRVEDCGDPERGEGVGGQVVEGMEEVGAGGSKESGGNGDGEGRGEAEEGQREGGEVEMGMDMHGDGGGNGDGDGGVHEKGGMGF